MVFKRLILVTFAFLAITSVSLAQKSAQATMKVQVRVVEGNSVSQDMGANYIPISQMVSGSGITELTTMTFRNATDSKVAIDQSNTVQLYNSQGDLLTIPITYNSTITSDGTLYKIDANWSLDSRERKGNYKGELVTSVSYH